MENLNTMQKRNKEPKTKIPGNHKKGNTADAVKVFYKGKEADLIVFANTEADVLAYRADPQLTELPNVVDVFQVFTAGKGAKGNLGEASMSQMQLEFGNDKTIEQIIDAILKQGKISGVENTVSNNSFEK
ncbi:similar to Saccharomyces cerevisiae YHR087W RTC3 Protein of unknown function involved in RNA metabolism [Maudiozyma saulgeensis]|uniref:Ribosome maturation protein SDO1/SBDS N-terminal domain-containing protein n=1 Tax=Maudiozyma saulgeensis TaxID=1789683 RepID=A0A1X7QX06_9SACH|nr:similar to Saccharomyces cerevisiae YHR087W RTC3 Protein of unknown function involved in RNA metabolism [Kazachstania saulgeensis]